ncbi:MAG: FimB/Mfa2 family fimbrial subunit [Tannerellaceae bacterium]|nr:FimB/Mfa2 family fimbrial subunit [Tannerellaceae bacterium]
MKTIQTSILFLLALLYCTGCVKEDLDDCPDGEEYTLVLLFEYLDMEGKDVFNERISSIDVAIYDENHQIYQWLNADEVVNNTDRSKTVKVDPGTYYIISWANDVTDRLGRNALLEGLDLEHTYIYHTLSTESCDPLHYAPDLRSQSQRHLDVPDNPALYTVEVLNAGTTYHTVSYMGAHRTVNVFLRGFPEIADGRTPEMHVSINNLIELYDCFLNHGEEKVVYHKKAREVTVEEEYLGFAQFYVPHFDNESPVTINIAGTRTSGASYNFSVSMDDVLRELDLLLVEGDCEIINVVIEFKDLYVQIKVPEWLNNPVDWK